MSSTRVIAEKLEHICHIFNKFLAGFYRLWVRFCIKIAIWKRKPALPGIDQNGIGILQVGAGAEIEHRADTGIVHSCDLFDEGRAAVYRGNFIQKRLNWGSAGFFNSRFIHTGRVEITDKLRIAALFRICL